MRAGLAAGVLAGLCACADGPQSGSAPPEEPPASGAGPGQIASGQIGSGQLGSGQIGSGQITLAGSTFAKVLYERWIVEFNHSQEQQRRAPRLGSYAAIGSQQGRERLAHSQADVAASDWPLDNAAVAHAARGGGAVLQVATVIGGIAPAYHIDGVKGRLRFSRPSIAGVFSGAIRWWDDPALVALNPDAGLPHRRIQLVHREDGSGTTHIFSLYMTYPNTSWHGGVGDVVQWPGGSAALGNDGVARAISLTHDAIGYVEYDYAMQSMRDIGIGCVENKRQECIAPDFGTVSRADCQERKTDPVELQECVINSPNEGAYPIAALTWLLVPAHIADADKRAGVKDFLKWMLTDGQVFATNYGFAPLPEEIAARQLQSLARMTF